MKKEAKKENKTCFLFALRISRNIVMRVMAVDLRAVTAA
jgi:hypothetical protein